VLVVEDDAPFEVEVSDLELDVPMAAPTRDPDLLEVLPGEETPPPMQSLGRVGGRDTLVREQDEADEIRRQISRPLVPEVSLEELEEEEEALEELSFSASHGSELEDEEFEFPAPSRPAFPVPSPGRSLEDLAEEARPAPRPKPVPPPPPPVEAAPAAPTPVRVEKLQKVERVEAVQAEAALVPVSVDLTASQGQADVAIPLEIVLRNGTAQVHINLRLTLNLRVTS
jgi:hypothetical protein